MLFQGATFVAISYSSPGKLRQTKPQIAFILVVLISSADAKDDLDGRHHSSDDTRTCKETVKSNCPFSLAVMSLYTD